MEKRAFERTIINLPIKYFCENMLYHGTIQNLSENGMYISTTNFLPCRNKIEMLVPLKDEVSKFNARIRRIEKVNDLLLNIGVELINPPDAYLEFVENCKSSSNACNQS